MPKRKEKNDLAIKVFIEIANEMVKIHGQMEQGRQARLSKVISELLKFRGAEEAQKWLLNKNKQCGNLPPIDLVNSEYATRHLMALIKKNKN